MRYVLNVHSSAFPFPIVCTVEGERTWGTDAGYTPSGADSGGVRGPVPRARRARRGHGRAGARRGGGARRLPRDRLPLLRSGAAGGAPPRAFAGRGGGGAGGAA